MYSCKIWIRSFSRVVHLTSSLLWDFKLPASNLFQLLIPQPHFPAWFYSRSASNQPFCSHPFMPIPFFFNNIVPRVMKLMIWLYLISILHQITRFADRSFTSVPVLDYNGNLEYGCQFSTSEWVYFLDLTSYYLTYYGFRILFVHTFPITALVVLNLLLFRALRRAQVTRDRLFKQNPNKSESSRMRDSTNTTVMLIVVVTVFLATETPLAICTVLHVIQNVINRELVSYSILNLVISVTNFAIMCSYPVNFAIYCGMSLQFRETFKDLFIRRSDERRSNPVGDRSTMRRPTEVQLLTTSRLSIANGQRAVTETNL